MACKKLTTAEREQMVDLMMHSIKRITLKLADKGVCPICSLDMFLLGVFKFHKEIGGVEAEEALEVLMHSYNRAYSGEACIMEDTSGIMSEVLGKRRH